MKNKCFITGSYRFEKFINGVFVENIEFHNLITDFAFNTILKLFNYTDEDTSPGVEDLNISYFAFGQGTSDPDAADTTLEDEQARKAYTLKTRSDKKLVAICSLGVDDANFTITEVGVFSGGSSTTDSGNLLSHALTSIEKNSNITYNIYYTLNLSEE